MSGEMVSFTRPMDLVVVQCCSCGIEYAIPQLLKKELLAEKAGKNTWCPNGHAWHFTGKTAEQKLREAQQERDAAVAALRAERAKPKVYETSAPRDECLVCHRKYIRLSTHLTCSGHRQGHQKKKLSVVS
jgi:hypothetical protein